MIVAGRTIAIGDIHGCSRALRALLEVINPGPADVVVALDDYIDRVPDSRGVLDQMVDLGERCTLVPLLGNHEEMLLAAVKDRKALETWLNCGATKTGSLLWWTSSWPRRSPPQAALAVSDRVPELLRDGHAHLRARGVRVGPTDGLPAALGLTVEGHRCPECPAAPLREDRCVGHTPHLRGEVLDLGFLVCIDTNCYRRGWLTGFDVHSGQLWQADADGRGRSGQVGKRA
jgi:serine/threonine protein phosphatase 1